MKNTYLIGKHLITQDDLGLEYGECCLCGDRQPSIPRSDIISGSWADHDYLGGSDRICIYCAACLGRNQERGKRILCTHFIATENELLRIKREDLFGHILNPPDDPFVFGITFNYKKHISFKASVNYPGQPYRIRTENYEVEINLEEIKGLITPLSNWYTICKRTNQEPTWFTKEHILFGCDNFKRIEDYGADKYLCEDSIIGRYRGTALLEVLTYALNKSPYQEPIQEQARPQLGQQILF